MWSDTFISCLYTMKQHLPVKHMLNVFNYCNKRHCSILEFPFSRYFSLFLLYITMHFTLFLLISQQTNLSSGSAMNGELGLHGYLKYGNCSSYRVACRGCKLKQCRITRKLKCCGKEDRRNVTVLTSLS